MSKKAAVFCPNPGVDRMYHLQSPLAAGQLFRTERAEIFPGSKGANVALALAGKGVPVTVFTFTGGRAGALSESLLTDRGVTVIGVPTACGVRENTKVVEPGGRSTEFNENGGPVSAGEAAALLSLAGNGTYDALFLCGSLPRGVAEDYYAAAIAAAKARGVKFGRPYKELPAGFQEVKARWERGELSARAAGKELHIAHSTFLYWVRGNKR